MHPEIEWHQAQGLPHGGLYRGLDEVRRNIFDPLDESVVGRVHRRRRRSSSTPGSEIVVLGRYRGVAKETGKQLDVPFVHVWTVENDKAVRFRQFLDTAGWVEALSP